MTLYLLGSIALTHPLFPHSNSGCKACESDALVFYLPSSRAEGFGAPSPAASCVVTPSELETLLLLWILLYCYFILPQMNLWVQLPLLHITPLFLNKKHLLAPFPTKWAEQGHLAPAWLFICVTIISLKATFNDSVCFFCCQQKYFVSDKHLLLLFSLICILFSRLVSYRTHYY